MDATRHTESLPKLTVAYTALSDHLFTEALEQAASRAQHRPTPSSHADFFTQTLCMGSAAN